MNAFIRDTVTLLVTHAVTLKSLKLKARDTVTLLPRIYVRVHVRACMHVCFYCHVCHVRHGYK